MVAAGCWRRRRALSVGFLASAVALTVILVVLRDRLGGGHDKKATTGSSSSTGKTKTVVLGVVGNDTALARDPSYGLIHNQAETTFTVTPAPAPGLSLEEAIMTAAAKSDLVTSAVSSSASTPAAAIAKSGSAAASGSPVVHSDLFFNNLPGYLNTAQLMSKPPKNSYIVDVSMGDKHGVSTADAQSMRTDFLTNLADQQKKQSKLCYPKSGDELFTMVTARPDCLVIILTGGLKKPYYMTQVMTVSSPKLIMSNPIDHSIILPVATGSGKWGGLMGPERAFDVVAGGFLDLKHVKVYAGLGNFHTSLLKLHAVGSLVRVKLGGKFTAFGCFFMEPLQTPKHFTLHALLLAAGGSILAPGAGILVMGGIVTLTGCQFLLFKPFGTLGSFFTGGAFLLLAGNAVLTGCYFVQANPFDSSVGVGTFIAVFGGTCTLVGGGIVIASGAQSVISAGKFVFVGGGVLVMIGYSLASAIGVYNRGGLGEIFVGGGVLIYVGINMATAFGCMGLWMLGQLIAVGGGVVQVLGGSLAITSSQSIYTGVGGLVFLGSGDLGWHGVVSDISGVIASYYAVGHTFYNGAGIITLLNSLFLKAFVIRMEVGLANEIFMGAGWVTAINTLTLEAMVIDFSVMLTGLVYLGTGGGVFINREYKRANVLYYSPNPCFTSYMVGGNQISQVNNVFISDKSTIPLNKYGHKGYGYGYGKGYPSAITIIHDDTKKCTFKGEAGVKEVINSKLQHRPYMLPDGYHEDPVCLSFNSTMPCYTCDVMPAPTSKHMQGKHACQMDDGCGDKKDAGHHLDKHRGKTYTPNYGNDGYGKPGDQGKPSKDDATEVHLLWRVVTAFCDDAISTKPEDCLTERTLQNILEVLLGPPTVRTYQLQVELTNVANPYLEPIVGPDNMPSADDNTPSAPEGYPACNNAAVFNVYVTTTDPDAAKSVNDAWDDITEEPHCITTYLPKDAVCVVTVEKRTSLAYGKVPPAFVPSTIDVQPSAILVAPGEYNPPSKVVLGGSYSLYLSNFPKGAMVAVKLMNIDGQVGDSHLFDVLMAGRSTKLDWVPSEGQGINPHGGTAKYYLSAEATELPLIFAYTTAFAVDDSSSGSGGGDDASADDNPWASLDDNGGGNDAGDDNGGEDGGNSGFDDNPSSSLDDNGGNNGADDNRYFPFEDGGEGFDDNGGNDAFDDNGGESDNNGFDDNPSSSFDNGGSFDDNPSSSFDNGGSFDDNPSSSFDDGGSFDDNPSSSFDDNGGGDYNNGFDDHPSSSFD